MKLMDKHRQLFIRVLIASGIGFIVFIISCVIAWQNIGSAFLNNRMFQLWTQSDILEIDSAITNYVRKMNSLPQSLQELQISSQNSRLPDHHVLVDKNGVLVDGWGRPYMYSVNGTSYTIFSYGRDGKPGGVGLDSDLSQLDPKPEGYDLRTPLDDKPPTLKQFFFELPTKGVIATCFVSGIAVFFMCLLTKRPRHQRLNRIVEIGLTMLAAVIVSMIISALHLPSGH